MVPAPAARITESDASRYGNLLQAGTVAVGNREAWALRRGVDEVLISTCSDTVTMEVHY